MKRALALSLAILGTMIALAITFLFLRSDSMLKLRELDWRRPLEEAIAEVVEQTTKEAAR